MFAWLKRLFDRSNDPVHSCELYRDKSAGSCAHVDGPLCDFPKCSMLADQTKDDARVFEGFDHEHAASEWAEWYDHHSAEYSIVGGTAAEVQVLREDEDTARAVLVTGQLSRTYSGHALPANARLSGWPAFRPVRVE